MALKSRQAPDQADPDPSERVMPGVAVPSPPVGEAMDHVCDHSGSFLPALKFYNFQITLSVSRNGKKEETRGL